MWCNLTEEWKTLNKNLNLKRDLSNFMRSPKVISKIIEEAKKVNVFFTPELVVVRAGEFSLKNLNETGVVQTRKGKGGGTWVTQTLFREIEAAFNQTQDLVIIQKISNEESCLKTIEQLRGVTLIRQYPCGIYKIDGYDPLNKIAYEIDGKEHLKQVLEDTLREETIKRDLGCSFVRISI